MYLKRYSVTLIYQSLQSIELSQVAALGEGVSLEAKLLSRYKWIHFALSCVIVILVLIICIIHFQEGSSIASERGNLGDV